MDGKTNKVSVVLRITGSASDVAMLASSLTLFEGRMEQRPFNVPAAALPDAWWAFEVTQQNQESTEVAIAEALDMLEPMEAAILNVANDPRFQIELDCSIEIEEERPVMEVSAHTLRRLARLNATLGFEVYDYRE